MHWVLVNCLGLSLPRKGLVRLTDRLNMTVVVDWDKLQNKPTEPTNWYSQMYIQQKITHISLPCSLIRIFAVSTKKVWVHIYPLSGQQRLIRLYGYAGWSKSLVGWQVSSCRFCCALAHIFCDIKFWYFYRYWRCASQNSGQSIFFFFSKWKYFFQITLL